MKINHRKNIKLNKNKYIKIKKNKYKTNKGGGNNNNTKKPENHNNNNNNNNNEEVENNIPTGDKNKNTQYLEFVKELKNKCNIDDKQYDKWYDMLEFEEQNKIKNLIDGMTTPEFSGLIQQLKDIKGYVRVTKLLPRFVQKQIITRTNFPELIKKVMKVNKTNTDGATQEVNEANDNKGETSGNIEEGEVVEVINNNNIKITTATGTPVNAKNVPPGVPIANGVPVVPGIPGSPGGMLNQMPIMMILNLLKLSGLTVASLYQYFLLDYISLPEKEFKDLFPLPDSCENIFGDKRMCRKKMKCFFKLCTPLESKIDYIAHKEEGLQQRGGTLYNVLYPNERIVGYSFGSERKRYVTKANKKYIVLPLKYYTLLLNFFTPFETDESIHYLYNDTIEELLGFKNIYKFLWLYKMMENIFENNNGIPIIGKQNIIDSFIKDKNLELTNKIIKDGNGEEIIRLKKNIRKFNAVKTYIMKQDMRTPWPFFFSLSTPNDKKNKILWSTLLGVKEKSNANEDLNTFASIPCEDCTLGQFAPHLFKQLFNNLFIYVPALTDCIDKLFDAFYGSIQFKNEKTNKNAKNKNADAQNTLENLIKLNKEIIGKFDSDIVDYFKQVGDYLEKESGKASTTDAQENKRSVYENLKTFVEKNDLFDIMTCIPEIDTVLDKNKKKIEEYELLYVLFKNLRLDEILRSIVMERIYFGSDFEKNIEEILNLQNKYIWKSGRTKKIEKDPKINKTIEKNTILNKFLAYDNSNKPESNQLNDAQLETLIPYLTKLQHQINKTTNN